MQDSYLVLQVLDALASRWLRVDNDGLHVAAELKKPMIVAAIFYSTFDRDA